MTFNAVNHKVICVSFLFTAVQAVKESLNRLNLLN